MDTPSLMSGISKILITVLFAIAGSLSLFVIYNLVDVRSNQTEIANIKQAAIVLKADTKADDNEIKDLIKDQNTLIMKNHEAVMKAIHELR